MQVTVVGVCALALTGCTAQKAEPPGLTASPATTTSSTPTPTPAADDEHHATDLSDTDGLGIVVVDTPDLTGPGASAHDAVAIFQVEYWRSQTQGAVSPTLTQISSATATDKVRYGVDRDSGNGLGYAGLARVTIDDVTVNGDAATADVCFDNTDVVFTSDGGSTRADFRSAGLEQLDDVTFSLRSVDGGVTWVVEDYTYNGATC